MEKLKNINRYHILVIFLICIVFLIIVNGRNFVSNIYSNISTGYGTKNAPESFEDTNINTQSGQQSSQQSSQQLGQQPVIVNDPYDAEIILYYATWCGYSRMFLPEWEKFVEYAKVHFPNIKVTGMRCEDGNEATCLQKGVQGYPTIILYPKYDTEINYSGERKADKIIEFINKNIKK